MWPMLCKIVFLAKLSNTYHYTISLTVLLICFSMLEILDAEVKMILIGREHTK